MGLPTQADANYYKRLAQALVASGTGLANDGRGVDIGMPSGTLQLDLPGLGPVATPRTYMKGALSGVKTPTTRNLMNPPAPKPVRGAKAKTPRSPKGSSLRQGLVKTRAFKGGAVIAGQSKRDAY